MHFPRSAIWVTTLVLVGCASRQRAVVTPPDLTPARQAIETARVAGAEERAPQDYARALDNLHQAEAALGEPGPESATKAERLGQLALEGAQCALSIARLAPPATSTAPSKAEMLDLRAQLDNAQAEMKRLGEYVTQLQRDKDTLNRGILRANVRLKGSASAEEATSAIAEARLLLTEIPPTEASTLALCAESIAKAEGHFRAQNYGAALFFALQAQEEASDAGAISPSAPPLKSTYTVKSPANLRRGPGLAGGILTVLTQGTAVRVLGAQGDWIRVRARDLTGWVHRSLLE